MGLWKDTVAFEDHTDEFSLWVVDGVAVVFHVAGNCGVDGVVSSLYYTLAISINRHWRSAYCAVPCGIHLLETRGCLVV